MTNIPCVFLTSVLLVYLLCMLLTKRIKWHASHWTSHLTPRSASSHAWSLEQHSNGSLSVLGCPGCKVTSTTHADAKPAQTPFFFRNFHNQISANSILQPHKPFFGSKFRHNKAGNQPTLFVLLDAIENSSPAPQQVWLKHHRILLYATKNRWYLTTPQREFWKTNPTHVEVSPQVKRSPSHPSTASLLGYILSSKLRCIARNGGLPVAKTTSTRVSSMFSSCVDKSLSLTSTRICRRIAEEAEAKTL